MNPQQFFKAALLGAACLAAPNLTRAAEFFLRAGAVTNTMPDGAQVVQWGFARDSAFGALDGAITVPGPVLLVPPNDPILTIRLDNDLPEPISIVINGQFSTNSTPAPVRNPDGRVRSFVQETAPGNTAPVAYTWPNLRPGTFLYLSGSHSQIQIPMGLYGAMKKDTNSSVAYPGVSYASDVVLLFSEIDPVLNDAVATDNFGPGKARTSAMGYEAKYHLINGRAYTNGQSPILAGDPGKTNLLRFLNASLETHVPILDGFHLRQVAEDGNLYPFPRNAYSTHLPPQKTLDALLINPPAGLYPLYDRRLGLVSGTNLSGGMLAHLAFALSPPLIVSQPASLLGGEGATVQLNVGASGSTPFSYQWRRNGANLANGTGIAGATTPTLALGPLLLTQAGDYSVVVANTSGSATSVVATLTILSRAEAVDALALTWTSGGSAPWLAQTLVTQDGIDAAQSGATPDSGESWLETTLTGPGTLSFWWKVSSETSNDRLRLYLNGTAQTGFDISGEVDWQFRTVAVASGSQIFRWRYSKNGSTAVGQDRAWLDGVTFTPPAPPVVNPPIITQHPTDRSVVTGVTVTFNVSATGTAPLSYQWRLNGTGLVNAGGISGATTASLLLTGVQPIQAGSYSVIVSNAVGNVTSSNAVLSVDAGQPPVVNIQPVDRAVSSGATVSFNVSVTGSTPLSYQWRLNGTSLVNGGGISGATTASLLLAGVQPVQAGNYSVIVSNFAGTTISSNAVLSVTGPPSVAPTNLIAVNSLWKYLENGSDQGTAWRNPGFVDSAWPGGAATLGYGNSGVATVIGASANNYITTYFRRSFTVANAAAYASLTVRLLRDDGGIVYLNGVEVFRSNMPTGTINYLTVSSGSGDEVNYYSNPVSPAGLVSGVNVICVEIHQKSAGSSDNLFNLELTGTLVP